MKRRTIALAVVLSLLLSVLMPTAVSSAEELAPLEAAESTDSPATAAEEAPEDLPEEAPPEPSAPAPAAEDGPLDAPADEQEQPDEGRISVDEQPFAEASPEEPQADWTQGEAEAAADVPEADAFAVAALGSDNVQYAGVTYLSQAAFASMSEAGQEVYVRAVDEITDLLDRGVPLYDVVFALYEDGDVAVHYTTPMRHFDESGATEPLDGAPAGPIAIADPAEGVEPTEEVEPAEEAEPVEEAEPAEEAELTDGTEAAPEIRSENVELIEELNVPIERIREGVRRADVSSPMRILNGDLDELEEMYAQSKEFFCDQLSRDGQTIFHYAEAQMVDGGETGIEMEMEEEFDNYELLTVFSALLDTYPWAFDWSNGTMHGSSYWDSYSKTSTITATLGVSEYYDESLEQRARVKAADLVDAGLESARKNYPSDLPYGMVRFFDQWLCANNYYNYEGTSTSGNKNRVYYYCHTSYGTLLMGYGVCESYATAMARLLDAAGIPNLYVVGDTESGFHAWNNVQMLNENYYMLDSTWNDDGKGSNRDYMLTGRDSEHVPTGIRHQEEPFDFPTLPKAKYTPSKGPVVLNQDVLYLSKGKSSTLKLMNSAYKNDKKSWKSSDTKVAKVKNGKVTAVGPGSATITLSCGGQTAECSVYVYQISGLRFEENDAASLTYDYTWEDELRRQYFWLQVEQKGYLDTAENIDALRDYQELSFSSSKKSVATVSASLWDDEIYLTVTPVGAGDATIKVGFGGKTATLKFRVRRALEDEWFRLEYEDIPYNGKARKPKVSKTELAPGDLKFNLRYANNTNAGIATVSIVGKGNYGTLEKRFFIEPAPFDAARLKITEAKSAYYNGAPQGAGIAVKLGKKKLKAGADYELLYDGSPAAPTEAGTYAVTIRGKNYAGTFGADAPHSFTIMPAPLSKLKLALKKTSVKANGSPVTAEALGLTLKYGKREIPANEYEIRFRSSAKELISAPSEPGSYTVVIVPTGRNIATDKKTELTRSFKIKR